MVDAAWSDRLLRFFRDMLAFYEEFLSFEKEKYAVLVSGKLKELDTCLKREQAFTLKARGFEHNRVRLLKEAGVSDGTFRELISKLEPSRQEPMKKLYGEISGTVGRLQNTNSRCSQMTRVKLGRVSHILSNAENHPELKRIYGKKLPDAEPGSTFSEKI